MFIHKLPYQYLLTLSEKQNFMQGYGMTLQQRFPGMSAEEADRISGETTGRLMLTFLGLLTGFICGLAATLLKF